MVIVNLMQTDASKRNLQAQHASRHAQKATTVRAFNLSPAALHWGAIGKRMS
jgi:hypothetical protein